MRSFLIFLLLSFSTFASFELFEKLPVQGILREGAELKAQGGQDGSGALRLNGMAKAAQYAFSYRWEKVESGRQYGISFATLAADNFQGTAMLVVNFADDNWKFDVGRVMHKSMNCNKGRWIHQQFIFTVPKGITKCEATVRLDKVPKESYMLLDNMRVADVTNDKGFFKARFLDTIFDNWTFLGQQHFENYSLGPGAAVVLDWKQAKAGEAFLEIHGDASKMQYPLIIYNLSVEPERNYRFSCWYNASRHFDAGIKLFMFECMDANRKHIDQPRVAVCHTKGEWKELVYDFKTPAGTELLDIMFNMRLFPKEAVIRFDQLKFEEGTVGPDLRQSFTPAEKTMRLSCPVLGDLGEINAVKNVYEISRMDNTLFRTLESRANEELIVKLDDYPDGEYMLHARVQLSNGKEMQAEARHFGVYKDPYWKNELGMLKNGDEAPNLWKNLSRKENVITAWNGEFVFGKALELQQISEHGGTRLLKRGLAVTVSGEPLAATGDVTWTDGHARTMGTVPVASKGLEGILKMTMDYMGFVRYELLIQKVEANIDNISVDYAVNDVEFVHRSDGSWSDMGAFDLKANMHWETNKRFHEMMMGNVDRGIAWYSPKYHPAISTFDNIVTTADVNGDFRVRLVNAPLQAGKFSSVEFAVMPWPFRPSADNWKHLRFRAFDFSNFNMLSNMKPVKYAGMPASRNDEMTMEYAKKPGWTLYQIPFYITDTMPEYRYFENEWQGFPARYYLLSKNFGKGAKMRKCDMRNRLWQDMYCYMCNEYLQKFPWFGFYYDCYGADLLNMNGEQFHPSFETRLFHERIYLTTNTARPGFFTFTHAGAQQACTSAGFTDVTLMGEQYRALCMVHTYYLDFMTLDQFRYENAVRIGPDRMFLPQYRQPDKIASPEIATHTVGLAYLHNCMFFPSFINADVTKRSIRWLYSFGLEDAQFFPYWKNSPHGSTTGDKTVPISYWKTSKGFFATVLNSTKEAKSVKVTLPENTPNITILNPLNGSEITFENGTELKLPPRMAVFLRGLQ